MTFTRKTENAKRISAFLINYYRCKDSDPVADMFQQLHSTFHLVPHTIPVPFLRCPQLKTRKLYNVISELNETDGLFVVPPDSTHSSDVIFFR